MVDSYIQWQTQGHRELHTVGADIVLKLCTKLI